ncbi:MULTISPECIES: PKD domain-containing protein [Pseudofrankia]|uniref:PKD domain-containing protein n=1 Tax=Pseudofrankia TaxID=2994363 RepID=UPI000234CFDA|nr:MULTISPECIES: PKD domain-containing protein [Pseudofrankia]OHV33355.1 hypothetical protein BCD49_27185 [Pseudofrankia sp. EUN1h]
MNDHALPRRQAIPRPWLLWLPRILLTLVLVGAVAGLAVALARPEEVPRRAVDLDDASAWLVSSAVGEAVLVDGMSGQIIARVDVGGNGPVGTQEGTDAFVSSADGTVRRIDGTTYRVDLPTSPFSGRGEPLELFPAPGALFAVSPARGVVFVVDPRTLRVRATVAVHATIRDGGVLADAWGRLWIVDAATGDLLRVDGDGRQARVGAVDPKWTRLISVSGRPVAVDLAAGRARPIEAGGVTGPGVCVDADKDGSVVVAGAGAAPPPGQLGADAARWIFLASQRSGLLFLSDLATRTCDDVIDLGVAGHRLGQPVEAAGLVFVPDLTASRVIVVDLAGRKVRAAANVPVKPGQPFELRRAGSVMFFNDSAGSIAGIIQPSGTVTTVEKYGPAPTGADEPAAVPPPPPTSTSPTPTPSTPPPSPTGPATSPPATARPTPPKTPPVSPPAAAPSPPPVVPPVTRPAPRGTSPEASRPTRPAQTTSAAPTGPPVVAPSPAPTSPPPSAPPVVATSAPATVPPPANPPTARLNVSQTSGLAPLPVRLDASGSSAANPAVPIVSYNFLAGPGGSITQTTGDQASAVVDLTFDTPGTWLVMVRVTDAAGNSAQSASIRVTVNGPPTAQPSPTPPTTQPPTTQPPTTRPPTTAPPTTTRPPTTTPPATTPPPTTTPPPATHTEVTGNTGSPTFATVHFVGPNTPRIGVNVAVQVRCRTTGDAVEDGNTWFYLVVSGVASGRYAPADNFYNNGATSGPHNNVFVDTKVPLC